MLFFMNTLVGDPVPTANIQIYALILFSVSSSAVAQLLLKIGMSQPGMRDASASTDWFANVLALLQNFWVMGGLGLYFLGALVWLKVLAKVELSFAYPFVGLGFILTMIFGKIFLGDAISLQRLFGTCFVIFGVLLIAFDSKA
jgi:multidrug transporter EmrE-like cation transporter